MMHKNLSQMARKYLALIALKAILMLFALAGVVWYAHDFNGNLQNETLMAAAGIALTIVFDAALGMSDLRTRTSKKGWLLATDERMEIHQHVMGWGYFLAIVLVVALMLKGHPEARFLWSVPFLGAILSHYGKAFAVAHSRGFSLRDVLKSWAIRHQSVLG